MAFRGTFDYTLDAKNRLTVPAKFRSVMADGVVLAQSPEGCVSLWAAKDYDAYVEATLAKFPPFSPQAERLELWFSANSHDTELDAQGRVMVPKPLLEHAGLSKEVVVTGAQRCLKVWSPERWSDFRASLASDITDIQSQLGSSS